MQNENEEVQATARAEAARVQMRRSSTGRALVACAVLAPALLIVGSFLLSQGSIYRHHISGPWWPWALADVALLLLGIRMMRGEDL